MKKFVLLSALIFLSACDYVYIISRGVNEIEYTPSTCIEDTLKQIDGLSGIHANTMRKQPNPALHRHSATTEHYYWYIYDKRAAIIGIIQEDTGKTRYFHEYGNIGPHISQKKFTTLVPKMREIDEAIAQNCKLFDMNEIQEKCIAIDICRHET